MKVSEAAEGMILGWLEAEAGKQIKERVQQEAREYEELKERNRLSRKIVTQWREEERLAEALGQVSAAYAAGRRDERERRNGRERERRRAKRKTLEQSHGNSGLQ